MFALGDQVDVHLAQDRREPVGIVDGPLRFLRAHPQAISKSPSWTADAAFEHAIGVDAGQVSHRQVGCRVEDTDPLGAGNKGTHNNTTAPVLVHAEVRERITVSAS